MFGIFWGVGFFVGYIIVWLIIVVVLGFLDSLWLEVLKYLFFEFEFFICFIIFVGLLVRY